MKPYKRSNVYEETYNEIMSWAYEQYYKFDVRADNNHPLHSSFSHSLKNYLEFLKR